MIIDPKAAKIVQKGMEILSKTPPDLVEDLVDVMEAVSQGRLTVALRLVKNSALAFAAKKAASERIKRTKK